MRAAPLGKPPSRGAGGAQERKATRGAPAAASQGQRPAAEGSIEAAGAASVAGCGRGYIAVIAHPFDGRLIQSRQGFPAATEAADWARAKSHEMDWWVAPSLAAGSKDVPRVALAVLRKCDCLNACGDDPGLRDRIAEPCPRRQKEAADIAAAIAQQERITQLLAQTGHATTGVLAALEQLDAMLAAQTTPTGAQK